LAVEMAATKASGAITSASRTAAPRKAADPPSSSAELPMTALTRRIAPTTQASRIGVVAWVWSQSG
jgi:hypothetical protein